MLCSHIVCEIWWWSFLAWLTRLRNMILSVLIITIQMTCVSLNLIQRLLIWYTLSWFGHSYVSEYSIHGTGYSLWSSYQWVSTQNLWVIINFENHHLLKFILGVSAKTEEKKDYVKPIMTLIVTSEIDMLFRTWVQYCD